MNFNRTNGNFWPQALSQKAITSTFVGFLTLNALFISYYTPIPLAILILGTVVFFFYLLNVYTRNWRNVTSSILYRKLFIHSMLYRVIFLGILYLYTWIYVPEAFPMHMSAADAWVYRAAGTAIIGNILNLEFVNILPMIFRNAEDWGFPVYIGFLYTYVYESMALILFLNAVWGSFTVVLLAKIANLLYTRKHAVMTGVIAMLMPAFLYYGAMYLKETVMIFLMVLVVYHAVKVVKLKTFNLFSAAVIIVAVPALYYFRPVVVVLVFLSLMIYFIMNFAFTSRFKMVAFVSGVILAFSIAYIGYNMGQIDTIERYYGRLGYEAEQRVGGKTGMVENINVVTSIAVPLVAANAFFAPYPSFTNIDARQIGVISHAHVELVRVLIYYFGLVGLLMLFRRDLVNSSLIIAIGAGYVLILAITGTAMLSRFHLPAVPFIILFMSVGYLNASPKWVSFYGRYLMIIWSVMFAWHIFKMAIRGMV